MNNAYSHKHDSLDCIRPIPKLIASIAGPNNFCMQKLRTPIGRFGIYGHLHFSSTTVASETLEGVFLLNKSMNIHHRTLKPSAMCFY